MIQSLVEQMPGGFHATNGFVRKSIRVSCRDVVRAMFWGSGLDGSVEGCAWEEGKTHFEHSRETLFIDSRITVRRFRWSGPFRKREVYSLDLLDITAVSMLWVDWSTKDCLIVAHQNFEVDFGQLLRSLSLQLQWFCMVLYGFSLFFGGCWRPFLLQAFKTWVPCICDGSEWANWDLMGLAHIPWQQLAALRILNDSLPEDDALPTLLSSTMSSARPREKSTSLSCFPDL